MVNYIVGDYGGGGVVPEGRLLAGVTPAPGWRDYRLAWLLVGGDSWLAARRESWMAGLLVGVNPGWRDSWLACLRAGVTSGWFKRRSGPQIVLIRHGWGILIGV